MEYTSPEQNGNFSQNQEFLIPFKTVGKPGIDVDVLNYLEGEQREKVLTQLDAAYIDFETSLDYPQVEDLKRNAIIARYLFETRGDKILYKTIFGRRSLLSTPYWKSAGEIPMLNNDGFLTPLYTFLVDKYRIYIRDPKSIYGKECTKNSRPGNEILPDDIVLIVWNTSQLRFVQLALATTTTTTEELSDNQSRKEDFILPLNTELRRRKLEQLPGNPSFYNVVRIEK